MKTTDTVRILTWLASNPGSTSGEIAAAIGLSRQHVHVCLLGAEIAGRVRRDRGHAAVPWRWEKQL